MKHQFSIGLILLLILSMMACSQGPIFNNDYGDPLDHPALLETEFTPYPEVVAFMNEHTSFHLVHYDDQVIVLMEEDTVYRFYKDGTSDATPIHEHFISHPLFYVPDTSLLYFRTMSNDHVYVLNLTTKVAKQVDGSRFDNELFDGGFVASDESTTVFFYATGQAMLYEGYELGMAAFDGWDSLAVVYRNGAASCEVLVLTNGAANQTHQFNAKCLGFLRLNNDYFTVKLQAFPKTRPLEVNVSLVALYRDGSEIQLLIPDIEDCVEVIAYPDYLRLKYLDAFGNATYRNYDDRTFVEIDFEGVLFEMDQILAANQHLFVGYTQYRGLIQEIAFYDRTTKTVLRTLQNETPGTWFNVADFDSELFVYTGILNVISPYNDLRGDLYYRTGELLFENLKDYREIDSIRFYFQKDNLKGVPEYFILNRNDYSTIQLEVENGDRPMPGFVSQGHVLIYRDLSPGQEIFTRQLLDVFGADGAYVGRFTRASSSPYMVFLDENGTYWFGKNRVPML